ETRELSLDPLRWGLIPHWCQDPHGGGRAINTKCETGRALPIFRDGYYRGRCLVPVAGFFEWQAVEGQEAQQPCPTGLRHGAPLGIGGIWENWKEPLSGEWIRTFAVITARAAGLHPLAGRGA